MIEVRISDEIRVSARDKQDEILRNIRGKNPNGFERSNRYFNGLVGELCFKRLLDKLRIRNNHWFNEDYKPDNPDFTIFDSNKPLTIDVKTASAGFHKNMEVPPRSYKQKHDLYVGCRIRTGRQTCEIFGYAEHGELKFLERDKNYGLLLTDLTPIENLIKLADKYELASK